MQDEKYMYEQGAPDSQIVVGERAMETFEATEPHPAQANGALTDASASDQEIIMREWVPNPNRPDYKFKIWFHPYLLKPSDQTAIQRKVSQLEIDGNNLTLFRNQLAKLKPDSRVEQREKTIREMSPYDDEFGGDEAAYFERKQKLQAEVDGWMEEYADAHDKKVKEIEAILAKPNYYQTLREDFFAKVIVDHTIGLPHTPGGPLVKVDFKSNDPNHELTDERASSLQEWLWSQIKKEAGAAKNSAKQKSKQSSR